MRTSRLLPVFLASLMLQLPAFGQQSPLRLLLRDGTEKPITNDEGCTGEALRTLPCHAVTVTIENMTASPLSVEWSACPGAGIFFEYMTDAKWENFPVIDSIECTANATQRADLGPHSHYDFPMFLRESYAHIPNHNRRYILRAAWSLYHCKSVFGKTDVLCDTPPGDAANAEKTGYHLTSNTIDIVPAAGDSH